MIIVLSAHSKCDDSEFFFLWLLTDIGNCFIVEYSITAHFHAIAAYSYVYDSKHLGMFS